MIVLNSAYRIAIKIQLEYVKIHDINVEKSGKLNIYFYGCCALIFNDALCMKRYRCQTNKETGRTFPTP